MKYLEGLNPQQKEAVLTTDGPMMILAGAGSGKTKTLISKIIHLFSHKKVKPWEILALTFSNRAANEMKNRLVKEVPDIDPKSLNLSTFHAFCAKVLRFNAIHLGLKSSFSIYDDSESLAIARAICKKHNLDQKKIPPTAICHFVDKVKNTGYYPKRKIALKKELKEDPLFPYYLEFETELLNNNAVDFGSLIVKTIELFENNPHILATYQTKYKYLLVDEYQDTNLAQFQLITLLASSHKNVCVVGDSDQCLESNSVISLDHGKSKNIQDILPSESVLSFSHQLEPVGVSQIHKSFYDGKMYTIVLDSGESLTTTADHVGFIKVKESSAFLSIDECKITYLGGSKCLHKFEMFNLSRESNDIEELYDFFQRLEKGLSLSLKEEIILNNQRYSLIKTKDMSIGDILPTLKGEGVVQDIQKKDYKGYVYDLNIQGTHNYVANGIFTHNSIYSWRGAEIRNILDFEKTFPNAKILKLEENYRSSKNIIQAASEMIKNNILRKDKIMFTSNADGEKIKIYQCSDGEIESLYVAQAVSQLLKNKVPLKEIAIFYRNNSQSRGIEDSFRKYRIPYNIIGGQKFYERKEIKDLLAYLQVIANPMDEMSLLRIINMPTRGLGEKTIDSLKSKAKAEGLGLYYYLEKSIGSKPASLGSPKVVAGVTEIVSIIREGIEMVLNNKTPLEIYINVLNKSNYLTILKASGKYEDQARVENLQELRTAISEFLNFSEVKTLGSYLETITLDRTEDNLDYGKVSLMTVHASKGLEFDHVFLIGTEENIFPSAQNALNSNAMEEERRLFYVAVTRARKEMNILYALRRNVFGKPQANLASRFISELPKECVVRFRV